MFATAVDEFPERMRLILLLMQPGMAAHGRVLQEMKSVEGEGLLWGTRKFNPNALH